ncbi:MAG TPA: PKD domain-containing protein [Planctomycetota bacterium]
MQRFAPLVAVAAFATASTAQFTLVTPNGYANTAANSFHSSPWGTSSTSMRLQYLIDSTHFTAQGVTTPISISKLRYRPRSQSALPISWAGGMWPNVRIDMATSPLDWAAVSPTFANNLGPDRTTVLQGPVTVDPGTTTVTGSVLPWHVTISLTTPFVYDPTSGNDLTIDIHLDGTGWSGQGCPADVVISSAATGAALGSRVSNQTGITATAGAITTNNAPVTEFTFVPAVDILPRFAATPLTPSAGQLVHFRDQTWTADPAGVTSWAWDVDGVPGTDYTTRNCSHTYTTEGPRNVSLTVTTALFGTQSVTSAGYIRVDAVGASFTASIAPGTTNASFADRSAGNPTSWAWDFENDGIVDSTLQNPVHTYPAGTTQSPCRLVVADAFSNDATTMNIGFGIVPLPVPGSTFVSFEATPGFWFRSPTRFSIVSARVTDPIGSLTQSLAIFRLAAPPPLISTPGSGGLEFFASNRPAASPIPCAVSYDAGECVGVLGASGTTFMMCRLGQAGGAISSSVLGVPTTLTRFSNLGNLSTEGANHPWGQEPSAQIGRVILEVSACAAIPYGTGSPSGLGPAAPKMRASVLPFLGQTAVHTVEQQDAIALQMMLGGFGRASFTLPTFGTILIGSLDLLAIMNGGALVGPGPTAWGLTVPNLPSLVGTSVNFQNVNLVLPSGAWSMSNGIEWVIGN